ncbi:MAG: hypothetical protein JWO86_6742 [Myxococcaceae bacterium]|nr:hypothetical protein [Myxococcaceae bacterium]
MLPKTATKSASKPASKGAPKSAAKSAAKTKGSWGGPRPGSGRKPGPNAGPAHRARKPHDPQKPLAVTLPRAKGLPSLRSAQLLRVVRGAIVETAEAELEGFRIVLFSIGPAQVDFVIEADDVPALTTGLRSLSVRIAMRINNALGRTGQIFRDRYRSRSLATADALNEAIAALGATKETAQVARTALLRKA